MEGRPVTDVFPDHKYDLEGGIAQARTFLRSSDPQMMRIHELAESFAKSVRLNLGHRDLRSVAEALILGAAQQGGLIFLTLGHGMNTAAMVPVNIQGAAGVLILDDLEAAEKDPRR